MGNRVYVLALAGLLKRNPYGRDHVKVKLKASQQPHTCIT